MEFYRRTNIESQKLCQLQPLAKCKTAAFLSYGATTRNNDNNFQKTN
jgi:hypothetical protein